MRCSAVSQPTRLRVTATRNTVLTMVMVFALVGVLFATFAAFAFVDRQLVGAAVSGVVCVLFGLAAQRAFAAELYADLTWVGCSNPWPQRLRRDDLAEIRYAGPFISPAWEFVRRDGSVAFRVSPFMYGKEAIARLTDFLEFPFPASYRGV
jgi:hypothetical protein